MKRIKNMTILIIMVFMISGCYSTGLSLRESGQFNYSNFVYALYGDKPVAREDDSRMSKPIALAVAQVGEHTPPKEMLDILREERGLIASVQTIPAGGPEPDRYGRNENDIKKSDVEDQMSRMRHLARDLGADYLFIFGGSVDYGHKPNILSILDITIVGAYIFPSVKHMADGRASGALVDVHNGRVLLVTDAQTDVSKITPSYLDYSQGEDQVLAKVRREIALELADKFIEKLKQQ